MIAETPSLYVVGGAVRDAMLEHLHRDESLATGDRVAKFARMADIDVVLPDHACDIARRVADQEGWAFYRLDSERDIARLIFTEANPPLVCDVARFQGGTLSVDLALRDFTVNAMAFELCNGWGHSDSSTDSPNYVVTLIDNHDGLRDLAEGQIRRVSEQSLVRDPIRLLRAVRFAAQLTGGTSFRIDVATRQQIVENAEVITQCSQERIRDELWKALATIDPAAVIEKLRSLGLIRFVLPEVANMIDVPQSSPHHLDVYSHTLAAVRHAGFLRDWVLRDNKALRYGDAAEFAQPECISSPSHRAMIGILTRWRAELRRHFASEVVTGRLRAEWLVWLALLHDIGKPLSHTEENDSGVTRHRFLEHEHVGASLTSKRLDAMHFSRDEVKLATLVVDNHMRPHHLNASFENGTISRRASYRFYRDVGRIQDDSPLGIDVVFLALADMLAIHRELNALPSDGTSSEGVAPFWLEYLEHAESLISYGLGDEGDLAIRQQRLVSGHQLMVRFDLQQGPIVGQLLELIKEAQAAGEIKTEEEALDWVASQLPEFSA